MTENIMAKSKKEKKINNDLQNTTQKNKDWATRNLHKMEVQSFCYPESRVN